MPDQFAWFGTKALEHVRKATRKGLEAGAQFLVDEVQEAISEPYPPASDPGDPPAARTYNLHDSYGWRWLGDMILIGTDVPYALWLEIGTSRMEARPHLYPTCLRKGRQAAHIVGIVSRLS